MYEHSYSLTSCGSVGTFQNWTYESGEPHDIFARHM